MSDPKDKDRWRELADLLGVPPDENPPPAKPVSGPSPAYLKEKETTIEEKMPAVPGAEEEFAEEPGQPLEVVETFYHEERVTESALVERQEPVPEEGDDAPPDRPRRGRRRGRRGQKGDAPERNERTPGERSPRMEEDRDIAEEPIPEKAEDLGDSMDDEPGDRERGRGRGGRRQQESRPRDREDEILDTEDMEKPEPVPEDDDDEEIDQLTDLNLPSWTDLIGSLYRPDR